MMKGKSAAPAVPADQLRKYCYFGSLSDKALQEIAASLEKEIIPAGTEIIRDGEAGDAFYFLARGKVEVGKKNSLGQTAVLSRLEEPEVFGEMALLTCSSRVASVRAKTDVTVYRLPKHGFEHIVMRDACAAHLMKGKKEHYDRYDQIKVLEPFARLDPGRMQLLMERYKTRTYQPEEDIVSEGEKGDIYFIITSGSAAVIKRDLEGKSRIAAIIGKDEAFGEEALLTDGPRSATVRTIEETTVLTLDKADFEDVIKREYLDEVAPGDVDLDAVGATSLLDVRTKMEFEEEYIPGAVSFPLDELRGRYGELDPERDYYTYCLVGARSSVASFLLQMHGIRARSIRGGIMGWPGEIVHNEHAGVHDPAKPT